MNALREFLWKRPPYQVLRLVYDAQYVDDLPPGLIDSVHRAFPTKHALLKWVFGDGNDSRLTDFSEWQNLRHSSLGKRSLVAMICAEVHHRYTWVTPKLIHAFAYRPTFFEQHPFKNWPKAIGLYQRREVPKGNHGKRTLLIPIPPLRRVQRALL